MYDDDDNIFYLIYSFMHTLRTDKYEWVESPLQLQSMHLLLQGILLRYILLLSLNTFRKDILIYLLKIKSSRVGTFYQFFPFITDFVPTQPKRFQRRRLCCQCRG